VEIHQSRAAVFGRVLVFLIGFGLAWAAQATKSAKSTTSRLEKSSRQLVGRVARKVESDSPVGIPGVPGRLVADLETRLRLDLMIRTSFYDDFEELNFGCNFAFHIIIGLSVFM
jgi:hypothetical protein